MKRVIVTGSRDWLRPEIIGAALKEELSLGDFVIVHGGCPTGADAFAEAWANANGIQTEVHPADWHLHGHRAGPIRNKAMVEAGAVRCLAFIRNGSRGASHCARLAKAAGITTLVWSVNDGVNP